MTKIRRKPFVVITCVWYDDVTILSSSKLYHGFLTFFFYPTLRVGIDFTTPASQTRVRHLNEWPTNPGFILRGTLKSISIYLLSVSLIQEVPEWALVWLLKCKQSHGPLQLVQNGGVCFPRFWELLLGKAQCFLNFVLADQLNEMKLLKT